MRVAVFLIGVVMMVAAAGAALMTWRAFETQIDIRYPECLAAVTVLFAAIGVAAFINAIRDET